MKEDNYKIVVHIANVILLGVICLFWLIASFSVSAPTDDPVSKAFQKFAIGFTFGLWAVSYFVQYKSKKRKWYLPFVGVVLYIVIVLAVLGYVAPFITELLFPAYYSHVDF